ncbi:MAG: cyclic nucleotide-binding domain-containing protein [Spirochaetia bacterium]
MSLIGVISTDEELNTIIREEFESTPDGEYILRFPEEEKDILELLNFDLPEIVIINFADRVIPLEKLLSLIQEDAWLHNFGIIGIYNQDEGTEEEIQERYKDLNILAMIDPPRLRSHVVKCAQIIEQNRQIIFHRELEDKLMERASGSFTIENDVLAVSVYASIAATILLQRGLIKADSKMHLQLCLSELIINGVEHGNCGITFEEKSEALERGLSMVELVEEKCQSPEVAEKRVHFEWEIRRDASQFIIRDEGQGFDVRGLQRKIREEGPYSLHGRGIRMARMFAHKLYYNTKGNVVVLIIRHERAAVRGTPAGFSGEEAVTVHPGEVIFDEGESSDFLYYIASGRFAVFYNDMKVGTLGPEDIFVGEMSFLLNNRRSATVRASTEGKLVKISRRAFVTVIKEYPHYGIFLSKLLARKLVRANNRNSAVLSPDV